MTRQTKPATQAIVCRTPVLSAIGVLCAALLLSSLLSCTSFNTLSKVNSGTATQVDSIPGLPPNTVVESNVVALSTAFTLPIMRYNRHKNIDSASDHSKGSVSLFNSVGAGINLSFGRLFEHTDGNSKVINTEMDNAYGLQLGFLFAANTEDGNRQDVFAFTTGISVLNFQFGYGYEFGHVVPNQRRGFFTLAYSIPVSKLLHGGFYVLKSNHKAHPHPYFPN